VDDVGVESAWVEKREDGSVEGAEDVDSIVSEGEIEDFEGEGFEVGQAGGGEGKGPGEQFWEGLSVAEVESEGCDLGEGEERVDSRRSGSLYGHDDRQPGQLVTDWKARVKEGRRGRAHLGLAEHPPQALTRSDHHLSLVKHGCDHLQHLETSSSEGGEGSRIGFPHDSQDDIPRQARKRSRRRSSLLGRKRRQLVRRHLS